MTSIIKVDEIQNKNGTTAITIDSSGRILQPAKPVFKMELVVEGAAANYSSATVFLGSFSCPSAYFSTSCSKIY